MSPRTAVDRFRSVAERYRKRADQTGDAALRQAYADLATGYYGLAANQEMIDRAHAMVGRLDAELHGRARVRRQRASPSDPGVCAGGC